MTQASNMNESEPRDNLRTDCMLAALDFEQFLARCGAIPDVDRLPHIRLRRNFEITGAVLLSLTVAGMSMLGNFLIFNVILHWPSF